VCVGIDLCVKGVRNVWKGTVFGKYCEHGGVCGVVCIGVLCGSIVCMVGTVCIAGYCVRVLCAWRGY
jgi:hypothetical protein